MERGSLVRLEEELDVAIDWRGFELHPETPVGGLPLDELFPREQIAMMATHVRALARAQGAGDMVMGERLSNTRRALAAAELAKERGLLDAFRREAMSASWQRGADLEDDRELAAIARAAGLDGEAAVAASRDRGYLARVDAMRLEAGRAGVNGIPTLVFGPGRIVVGAQPYQVIARAAEAAGARRRDV